MAEKTEKRVTYLIGAGASANALPVVNGMNERMKLFYNILYDINAGDKYVKKEKFEELYELLEKCTKHQTIDTYAKKLWYKKDDKNYNLLKRFLVAYLIFEQVKNNLYSELKDINFQKDEDNSSFFGIKGNRFFIKDEKKIRESIEKNTDERYDSFFAANLNESTRLKENINIISWNYDLQFEISFADFIKENKGLDEIQDDLQVFPRPIEAINTERSAVIKINGTGAYRDSISGRNENIFDIINEKFSESRFIEILFMVLFAYREGKNVTIELKFAWEKDDQTENARIYAKHLLDKSDAVVIIGYSFPTFNREIDRLLFQEFNKKCISRYDKGLISRPFSVPKDIKFEIHKKIYIQDTPENAPKIKERLKAVGDNLFDVAEIYDDVDQFFIPPEL